jgi:hypothetical protein
MNNSITDIMNLIGYGLAKFDLNFVHKFGFNTKSAFARYIVSIGLANTEKAVFNRQDSFDPYFDNGRKGWWQRTQRKHIKLFIDSLFGNENVHEYANIIKYLIQNQGFAKDSYIIQANPIVKSKFKQLQETGKEAEYYFMCNYQKLKIFEFGILEDARLWGDGFDFQIQTSQEFLLTEIKGIQGSKGAIRLTQNEYNKAIEYQDDYFLIVISNLSQIPKMNVVQNPVEKLNLIQKEFVSRQINYHSSYIKW